MHAGTTCATVLTRAIFTEGCKSVAAGMNAMDLRRGISMAVDSVVTNLKSRARMISTSEEIAQVCLQSNAFSLFKRSLRRTYDNIITLIGWNNIRKWREGNW